MFVLQVAMVKGRGGIATAIAHYERMFRTVGVRSALLFSGPDGADLQAQGADVIPAPSVLTSPFARLPGVLSDVRRAILERAGGDEIVVIVHSDRTMAALQGLLPNALFVAPCHSDKTKHKASADLVITLNEAQHAAASAALPSTRVRLLGNPFVPASSQSAPQPQSSGPPRINFVGRFEGFKDPLTLVRAFLAAALPTDITLRLIGAGALETELRAAAAPAAERIEFAGWLPDAFSHFDARDVLVLPSTWESYSYVIREALHFGVPVLASDIHVHRSALGDGAFGRLFPVADATALAAVLQAAVSDLPSLRAQAARGGDMVRATYGAEPFFKRLSEALKR